MSIEDNKIFSPRLKNKLIRLFFRMFPFGGPELYDILIEIRKSKSELDQQVIEAVEALQASSDLVIRLEQALQQRSQKLEALKEEYERFSELSDIEEKKVKALIDQLEVTLGKERWRDRIWDIVLNITVGLALFVLGAIASPYIQEWFKNL